MGMSLRPLIAPCGLARPGRGVYPWATATTRTVTSAGGHGGKRRVFVRMVPVWYSPGERGVFSRYESTHIRGCRPEPRPKAGPGGPQGRSREGEDE
eukprot:scaffold873_cov393-Prasinococcus_capsulatus_cf.AAC.18